MKTKFETYLKEHFPTANLKQRFSLGGNFELRFELGDTLPNGSLERVKKATSRALTLFETTFAAKEEQLWMVAYEYIGDGEIYKMDNPYFHQLLLESKVQVIHQTDEWVESGYVVDEVDEKIAIRITIAVFNQNDFNVNYLFEGIANLEMGLDPAIPQRIYFFSIASHQIFHMYDDRGCWLTANEKNLLKPIFKKYENWIVDYHRPRIEAQFE